LDGYKHKEISEMLGISTNTSKTQLLRARNAIRKNMEKKGYFFNF
jgi:RNA polymerase sigma-70 factor (ECF subfamily)